MNFSGGPVVNTSSSRICLQCRTPKFDPWFRKIPWRWEWQPTSVFLPGEFHEQRSLVGYSPWGQKESDMTEQLTLSNAADVGLIPGQEAKTHMPHSQKTKQNKTKQKKTEPKKRSNIITNSIKTLQMVHIKKYLKINE